MSFCIESIIIKFIKIQILRNTIQVTKRIMAEGMNTLYD